MSVLHIDRGSQRGSTATRFAAVLGALAIAGATANVAQAATRQIDLTATPNPTFVDLPLAGQETEVEVGETMLSTVIYQAMPTVVVRSQTVAKFGTTLTADPGVYKLLGRDKEGRFFQSETLLAVKGPLGTVRGATGGVYLPDGQKPPELYWRTNFSNALTVPTPKLDFEERVEDRVSNTSDKTELVYAGGSTKTVRLTFQHTTPNGRVDERQDLTYDLNDGDEIGFRGARIRVIKASNTSIRYIVLKPLSRRD